MTEREGIACVVYAAKSTEDKRGSIPDQLHECREAIESDPRRRLVAEYKDEAVSAYRSNRGPGLKDATEHAEDLAAEEGVAELWAQHSDRIARGDGRAAQHTVEIALWALKNDVRVRTLQDPETFSDLLYAVVTGQRNNEDSKRKALASQGGRRRAIARGEFVAHLPDGYKLRRELDDSGQVRRQMELDPDRQPLLELIFRLALRGRTCGQIAHTINDRGWVTKPVKRTDHPRPFDVGKVWELLQNPRYAALSVYRGEVLARGHWPAYVSERQHERIKARLAKPRARHGTHALDAYLLKGLARCGRCGAPLRVHTGVSRRNGTRSRAYVCASHRSYRGAAQCPTAPFDAHVAEAMVIASLPLLLADELNGPGVDPGSAKTSSPVARSSEMPPVAGSAYGPLAQHILGSQRRARELADTRRLAVWIESEARGRSEESRALVGNLRRLIASWFTEISITVDSRTVVIRAVRRRAGAPGAATVATIDRVSWSRLAPIGHRQFARRNAWDEAEMLGALQAWSDEHGRSPRRVEWREATCAHPSALTVCSHFGEWTRALRKAGLPPVPPARPYAWTPPEIIEALQRWTRRSGSAPKSMEWARASPGYPSAQTVRAHFGHFTDALHAAGLVAERRRAYQLRYWTDQAILESLRAWTERSGRQPCAIDWICAGPRHPCASTVRNHFRSWQRALRVAGLAWEASGS
jgi:hypothetical protein